MEVPLLHGHGDQARGTSFSRTCLNALNAMLGIGILSVPYALSQGGWWSLGLHLLIASICCYTGILLKRCMSADPRIRSYPDIGEYAFGSGGRMAVSLFLYAELYLIAVEFLILEGDNMGRLLPEIRTFDLGVARVGGKRLYTVVAALVILPTTWLRDLSVFALVSAGGVVASVVLVVMVAWVGVFDGVGFGEKGVVFDMGGFPTAMGLYTFCYSAHTVFPTLYTSMENKRHFSKVLCICFLFSTTMYAATGVMGYLMYGQKIESQITLNLPEQSLASYLAISATLANPITKYALLVTPIYAAVEERCSIVDNALASNAARTLMVASTLGIALSAPFFSYVMALIGSLTAAAISILFPCICYLRIFHPVQIPSWEKASIAVSLATGTSIAVVGTCTSVADILRALR